MAVAGEAALHLAGRRRRLVARKWRLARVESRVCGDVAGLEISLLENALLRQMNNQVGRLTRRFYNEPRLRRVRDIELEITRLD
jgi:hypothetical protein